MKGILKFVKTTIAGGFFGLLPVVLIVMMFMEVYTVLVDLIEPVVNTLPVHELGGVEFATLIAITVLLLVCFAAGVFLQTSVGSALTRWIEAAILQKIPGFRIIRSVIDRIAGIESESSMFKPAVYTVQEDTYALVYVIEEHENGYCTIQIPSSPSGSVGPIRYVRREALHFTDSSLGTVFGALTQWGVGAGPVFAGALVGGGRSNEASTAGPQVDG